MVKCVKEKWGLSEGLRGFPPYLMVNTCTHPFSSDTNKRLSFIDNIDKYPEPPLTVYDFSKFPVIGL